MYTLLIKDGPDRDLDIEAELADEPPPLTGVRLPTATDVRTPAVAAEPAEALA